MPQSVGTNLLPGLLSQMLDDVIETVRSQALPFDAAVVVEIYEKGAFPVPSNVHPIFQNFPCLSR